MTDVEALVERFEELLARVEGLDDPVRDLVLDLLDGVDALHRVALLALGDVLGEAGLHDLRRADPALEWLLDAYGVGVDQREEAERALDAIRPYIDSHGGIVEVVAATGGVVHLRMAGACAGCSASAVTLREGVEQALLDGFPGFAGLAVEEDEAAPHPPPPGPALVQLTSKPVGLLP